MTRRSKLTSKTNARKADKAQTAQYPQQRKQTTSPNAKLANRDEHK